MEISNSTGESHPQKQNTLEHAGQEEGKEPQRELMSVHRCRPRAAQAEAESRCPGLNCFALPALHLIL